MGEKRNSGICRYRVIKLIRIRPKRYECPCCAGKPATTQRVSWYDVGSPHTRASEDHIMFAMVSSTVKDVSMKEDIGYGAVMGMIGRRAGCGSDRNSFRKPGIIWSDVNISEEGA